MRVRLIRSHVAKPLPHARKPRELFATRVAALKVLLQLRALISAQRAA
jgi:hypothetical protein